MSFQLIRGLHLIVGNVTLLTLKSNPLAGETVGLYLYPEQLQLFFIFIHMFILYSSFYSTLFPFLYSYIYTYRSTYAFIAMTESKY